MERMKITLTTIKPTHTTLKYTTPKQLISFCSLTQSIPHKKCVFTPAPSLNRIEVKLKSSS